MTTQRTTRVKKAIAAGLIGLTALGATGFAPSIASAQDTEAPTQEQREARKAERDANRAERDANREARKAERIAVLTDALGVGEDVLQAARDAGQSLADVATAEGVPVADVVAAIVDAKTEHLQAKVGDRLTQEEADERIAGLEDRVTEQVNAVPGERGERGEGHSHRGPRGDRGPRGGAGAEA